MIPRYFYIALLLVIPVAGVAQYTTNDGVKAVTQNENSIAFKINSNGMGLGYRYGKRLDGFRKRIFDFDISYVKHPKEIKTQNSIYTNQKRFVFGKLNTMADLRTGIGLQKELFSKFDKGGVAIKYFYKGGFSLALLKPIYYEVVDSSISYNNARYIYLSDKKFDYTSIHSPDDIYGRSPFLKGMNESTLYPGIFAEAGLSFVYSSEHEVINAIEAGVVAEAFNKVLPIMATQKNDRFFVSVYISYRFGKVGIRIRKKTKHE